MMKRTIFQGGKAIFAGLSVAGLSNHFIFKNSTSCKSKEEILHNHFSYGVKVIPHPAKAYKGGEDAYFANNNVLAVADGVGGWADYGVDPGLYSKELCKHIETLVSSNWDLYKHQPKKLLIDAAGKTKSTGSSTLCILNLDQERPYLYSSYIGDSGYLVLRRLNNALTVVYQSQDHQRSFNFPYQIGTNGDPPGMAINTEHQIQHDDIVVTATDGLFDNMDEKQIIDIITPFIKDSANLVDPNHIADLIAQAAYKYSLDRNYNSPFAKKAALSYLFARGGKSDDITVLVGQIKIVPSAEKAK